jgi:outer membrane protein
VAAERASRSRIALARTEAAPQIVLRGSAATNGPLSPFDVRDQDVAFAGRATLSIPLSTGGRVRALVAQAQNRNTADELRIEATRRQVVQALVTAWNQWAAAEQNAAAQRAQLEAATVFLDGSVAEYRQGLRSTFDVLFAQNSLRDAETALLFSLRDSYVARAAILRRIGLLEAERLLEALPTHDPAAYERVVRRRNAVPWGGVVRAIDQVGAPSERRPATAVLPVSADPRSVPAVPAPPPATISENVGRQPPSPPVRTGKRR